VVPYLTDRWPYLPLRSFTGEERERERREEREERMMMLIASLPGYV